MSTTKVRTHLREASWSTHDGLVGGDFIIHAAGITMARNDSGEPSPHQASLATFGHALAAEAAKRGVPPANV